MAEEVKKKEYNKKDDHVVFIGNKPFKI